MYIITAIPIIPLPRPNEQVFSYFFNQNLNRGSLVSVPFGKRMVRALVLFSEPLEEKKLTLRKASYKLKGVREIFNSSRVLSEEDIRFSRWLSRYLFSPLGLVLRTIIPHYLLQNKDVLYAAPEFFSKDTPGFSFEYLEGEERFEKYQKLIKKTVDKGGQALVIFPKIIEARSFFEGLPASIKKETFFYESSLPPKQEFEFYKKLFKSAYNAIIGTRGAVFLPLTKLSLVILEGEDDNSHKSWDQHPRYDARVASIYLAKTRKINLVWGSKCRVSEHLK